MTTFLVSDAALVVAGTAYRFVSGVGHAVAVEEAERYGVEHAMGVPCAGGRALGKHLGSLNLP
jgi:hypothetical protein